MDSKIEQEFPTGIKLITFDLDDTLWPCMPVINQAERVLHGWLLQHAPRLGEAHSVETLRAHRRLVSEEQPDISHNLTLTRKISLQRLLREYDYDTVLADEAVGVFRKMRNQVEPFNDVIPALRKLRRHYCLIAVTNGNVQVSETPLAGMFQHSLTAEMVGAAKPDPTIFHQAMQLAATGPEMTLHVGDDPDTDIEAARNAGIHTVWVNRYRRHWPRQLPSPVEEYTSLSGLTERLLA